MKFRIKHVEGEGYFAQTYVQTMFVGDWYRISHQFNLYDKQNDRFPMNNRDEALERIEGYKRSLEPRKATYEEIET